MPVVLYTRRGCHLCEAAEDTLAATGLDVQLVDIDQDAGLAAAYGVRIPVVEVAGEVVLEGRFDERQVAAVLPRLRGRA